MQKLSFNEFENFFIMGYWDGMNNSKSDDLEMVAKCENANLFTEFQFVLQKKKLLQLPNELNHLKPILVDSAQRKRKIFKFTPVTKNENWATVWKHLLFSYLYLVHGKKINPWDALEYYGDKFNYDYDILTYYAYSDSEIKKELLNIAYDNLKLPEEFVQLSLLNQSTTSFFKELAIKLFRSLPNSYSANDKKNEELINNWSNILKSKSAFDFLKMVLKKAEDKKQPISNLQMVLISYIFSIEFYYRRLNLKNYFVNIKKIDDELSRPKFTKKNKPLFLTILLFMISKFLDQKELVYHVNFFPDYSRLLFLTDSFYHYLNNDKKIDIRDMINTYVKRVKSNLKDYKISYLSMVGKLNNRKNYFQLETNLDQLTQIMYLPPYIYRDIIVDILKINIELTNFSKNILDVSPESLYEEYSSMKENQYFNLKDKNQIDKWLEDFSEKIQTKLNINLKNQNPF